MTKIIFCDLTHTGTVIDANNFPLGIGYIAAAAKTAFGDSVDVALFKYPDTLSDHLDATTPDLACFSNYMWNERLQLTYAREIKRRHPQVVTIFGGPNYPIDPGEQHGWMAAHPEVDFYIDGEGEGAFVEFVKALRVADLDIAEFKSRRTVLPNLHYMVDGEFIRGELSPRTLALDAAIPSPFLMGLMDGFFDGKLTPMLQTSRGCPYSCTFCHDGISYMSKTRRFSQARIEAELEYVASRIKVPAVTLADLNWGMFPEDVDTAKTLARMKQERQWPRLVQTATAKNQKDRVVDMARILGDSMHIGASIQSTAPDVLKNIKRSNIGFDAIVAMAKESKKSNTSTFTEIILALPGDTKEKHFQSVFDMMDADIQDMRTFQFVLLPGTEANDPQNRAQHKYITRFRVLPRCFGRYTIYGEALPIAEMHEVCVGNETMPLADYTECRRFNLSLAVFNNGNIIDEIFDLGSRLGVRRSSLMARIHASATAPDGPIRAIYDAFRADEEKNFWPDQQTILDFLAEPGRFDEYLAGEYGTNQIYKYRATAIFTQLPDVVALATEALREELRDAGELSQVVALCVQELGSLIIARKSSVTEVDEDLVFDAHFDFERLVESGFADDPVAYYRPDGLQIVIGHTPDKRTMLQQYFDQYGRTMAGLMYFIHRNPARVLYREFSPGRLASDLREAG